MRLRTLSVKELNAYIGQSINLDQILKNISVEGEISNFKLHSNGNAYFSLKDEKSKINCIMFENSIDATFHSQKIADGDKVICQGSVNYYDREGYINLIVSNVQRIGEGQGYQEFLRLKKQLMEEGLFDGEFKKTLPSFPKKIGVVTSPTGAVIRDIYHVIKRRYPKLGVLVYPARVQGLGAAKEIENGINYFQDTDVDLMIIARGGGSYEELSAFNDESLAYAIFKSRIPIISAVGHETDFTIADFVADIRASTPSVAAEIAVPRLEEILLNIDKNEDNLKNILSHRVEQSSQKLERMRQVLESKSPGRMILNQEENLRAKKEIMRLRITHILQAKQSALEKKVNMIFFKNPNTVYEMGGAYITNQTGHKITSVYEIEEKMKVNVSFKDGQITMEVLEKNEV